MFGLKELSRQAWLWIWRWTALILSGVTVLSVVISELALQALSRGINGPNFIVSVVMPTVLGGPVLVFCLVRQQQLRLANQKLHVLATTDWLTACLNRRAFTHQASAHLDQLNPDGAGALLVIDADHFKQINDWYGHDRGDEALVLLVETIRHCLRPGDLLGRLGGEEFAVFLTSVEIDAARDIAENIRREVERARFVPGKLRHQLSISIGGAAFVGPLAYATLFQLADEQLYRAKQTGRNRVAFAEPRPAVLTTAA